MPGPPIIIDTFNTKQLENIGSVLKVVLFPVTGVYEVDLTARELNFNEQIHPLEVDFTQGTARYSEDEVIGANGASYKQALEFFIPGDNSTLATAIENMLNMRYFAKMHFYETYDDEWRLAGNTDLDPKGEFIGMELTRDYDSKATGAGLKGYRFSLRCESRIRAPWMLTVSTAVS